MFFRGRQWWDSLGRQIWEGWTIPTQTVVEFVFLFQFHKATHDTIFHKAAGCLIASQLGIVFWGIAMTAIAIVCQHFGNQTHFKLLVGLQNKSSYMLVYCYNPQRNKRDFQTLTATQIGFWMETMLHIETLPCLFAPFAFGSSFVVEKSRIKSGTSRDLRGHRPARSFCLHFGNLTWCTYTYIYI